MRARLFEEYARANNDHGRRITSIVDQVAGLEAQMADMATLKSTYHESVVRISAKGIKLEGE